MSVRKEEKVPAFFSEEILELFGGDTGGSGVSSFWYDGSGAVAAAIVLCNRLGAERAARGRVKPSHAVEATRLCMNLAIPEEGLYPTEVRYHCSYNSLITEHRIPHPFR